MKSDAVVESVKKMIETGSAPEKGAPPIPITYAGKTFFTVSRGALKCSGCTLDLVPQYPEGMATWTQTKEQFVRHHVRCTR